jgi:hypothetical protein
VAANTFALRVIVGSPSVSFKILVSMRALSMETDGMIRKNSSRIFSTLSVGSWTKVSEITCTIK